MADTDRIRARAHELWEAEGRPEGRDRAHWSQAEQEMAAAETGPDPDAAPRSIPAQAAADGPEGDIDDGAEDGPDDGAGTALQQGTNAPGARG